MHQKLLKNYIILQNICTINKCQEIQKWTKHRFSSTGIIGPLSDLLALDVCVYIFDNDVFLFCSCISFWSLRMKS
jgi:hypothetical protein